MRRLLFGLVPVVMLLLLSSYTLLTSAKDDNKTESSVIVRSLRGPVPVPDKGTPAPIAKFPKERPRPNLQYIAQPPLIPHSIRGYEINLNSNKCLACHGWNNAERMNATRISITHFIDRNGKVLADVAPSRYFCNQCHVPQANAKPLQQNLFVPVESLQK